MRSGGEMMAIVRMASRFGLGVLVVVMVAASFAAADSATSIVTVFNAEGHMHPPVMASVIKADATATEYLLQCGELSPNGRRHYCVDVSNSTVILTVGPSTMALMGSNEIFTRGFDCKLPGPSSARCDLILGSHTGDHFSTDIQADEYASLMMPLTITAGLEKLTGASNNAAPETTSTAVPQSTATRTDASVTKITTSETSTLGKTETTEQRTTAPAGSSSPAEGKPTTPSAALTTADKPASATNMRGSVAPLGGLLGLAVMALVSL